jgi:23S rRNA (cytidine1920-2'-O)/16S rRNA (cytidine1409-2'-O)-methyltransferase
MKKRLDQLLLDRGLFESREKARRSILAGKVKVNGHVAAKAGHNFPDDVDVEIQQPERFVSRGGEKMLGAFEAFPIDVQGQICIDCGASTGGFTDCLLQHGAARVYAVDVGTNQLHWKLQEDERVIQMDNTNARYLTPEQFPCLMDGAVIDVAFISLTKILPAVTSILKEGAWIMSLIKPQFEAGRDEVGKGGVVRNPDIHQAVIDKIKAFGEAECGLVWQGLAPSPIKGPKGNIEFLAYWLKS